MIFEVAREIAECTFERYIEETAIRDWMDNEISRMGEWFRNFEITWHNSGDYRWGQLYLWSTSKPDCGRLNHPFGSGLMIGEAYDENGNYIHKLQDEGRKLYYSLKKDYTVKRDLGRGRYG